LTTSASIFSKYNMLTWSFTIDSSLQVYNQRCVLQISTFAIMLRRYIQYQQFGFVFGEYPGDCSC
jgi:hypothetical protein